MMITFLCSTRPGTASGRCFGPVCRASVLQRVAKIAACKFTCRAAELGSGSRQGEAGVSGSGDPLLTWCCSITEPL